MGDTKTTKKSSTASENVRDETGGAPGSFGVATAELAACTDSSSPAATTLENG